jgi:hypothetical protein
LPSPIEFTGGDREMETDYRPVPDEDEKQMGFALAVEILRPKHANIRD